jgi:hypothetical protein
VAIQGKFAEYKEVATSFKPQVKMAKVSEDLSNLENAKNFEWVFKDNKRKILDNGFVVIKGGYGEFFPLYEENRYAFTPNFITTDSVVHSYHLIFNALLEKMEKAKLAQVLKEVTVAMLENATADYEKLKGTVWENAAKRNMAYFAVAGRLLDDNFAVPTVVKEPVEMELKLIDSHQGVALSPVINLGLAGAESRIIDPSEWPSEIQKRGLKEDYTQYIPRGHYDKSDFLKRYFKAMMWYGRLTFRFKETDEVKSAVLLNFDLSGNKEAFAGWETINETINFFVGKSDDVDYFLFKGEMDKVYGEKPQLKDLTGETKLADLERKLAALSPPAINSIPIYRSDIQSDREKEVKGFRFMGQKFTIDASIFQKLVCREVGTKDGSMNCGGGIPGSRMLPKSLDIPAAFGSAEAYAILKSEGETQYKNYPENMESAKAYLGSVSLPIWTQDLYWGWIYSLRPLVETRGAGYPTFMQNSAWLRKQLNTFLGSWTELKHDTILYAKQVYAEMGGGPPEAKDDRGYVEPEPVFYARLAALTRMTSEGLSDRGLADQSDKDILKIMEDLCLSLKTISEKELNNQALAKEEYDLIRGYGGSLEHLYMKAMEDNCKDKKASQCLDDNPAALVADVATDPNGYVLEEATGKIDVIYVIVPVEGKLKIAKGGVFSYYEFTWPMADRLTDGKWREMLTTNKEVPPLPNWTGTYRGK